MSAAAQPAEDPDQFGEGWRTGHRAALFVPGRVEAEASTAVGRAAIETAIRRVEAIERPRCLVPLPRAGRLTAAIRAALALSGAVLPAEAIAILKDAVQ